MGRGGINLDLGADEIFLLFANLRVVVTITK